MQLRFLRESLVLGLFLLAGCSVRETHTARTSTEQFLVAQAAERAVRAFDSAPTFLRGKRVFLDGSRLDGVDREYVLSAMRHHLSESGALLVPAEPIEFPVGDRIEKLGPQLVVELRTGSLGIKDSDLGFGLPILPLPIPTTSLALTFKPTYFLNRRKQEGWAKLQLYVYDAENELYVASSKDLWGHSYYSQWWFLLLGPFDFSYDVYPITPVDGERQVGPKTAKDPK